MKSAGDSGDRQQCGFARLGHREHGEPTEFSQESQALSARNNSLIGREFARVCVYNSCPSCVSSRSRLRGNVKPAFVGPRVRGRVAGKGASAWETSYGAAIASSPAVSGQDQVWFRFERK